MQTAEQINVLNVSIERDFFSLPHWYNYITCNCEITPFVQSNPMLFISCPCYSVTTTLKHSVLFLCHIKWFMIGLDI